MAVLRFHHNGSLWVGAMAAEQLQNARKILLDPSSGADKIIEALNKLKERIDLAYTRDYRSLLGELVPAFKNIVTVRFPPSVSGVRVGSWLPSPGTGLWSRIENRPCLVCTTSICERALFHQTSHLHCAGN
jgi:hypothetical protein